MLLLTQRMADKRMKGPYTAFDFISADLIISKIENIYWNEVTNWTRPNPEPRYANGLVLVTGGCIDYVFGSERFTGRKGDVLLLPKGIPYSGTKQGTEPNSYYVLDFETRQPDDCLRFPLPFSFPAADFNLIEDLFRHVLQLWSSKNTATQLKCRSGIYALLTAILEDYALTGATKSKLSDFAQITNFIGRHFTDPKLNVRQICATFFISESQLRRIFRKALAQSPLDYIQSLRLDLAKSILSGESGNASIEETACACGFSSLAYFSRLFKKMTGVPPSRFLVERLPKL